MNEIQEKPSKLDYILALAPIPVIGEEKAKKIASYHAQTFSSGNLVETQKDLFVAMRIGSYLGTTAYIIQSILSK
jgi:hypothetical protein